MDIARSSNELLRISFQQLPALFHMSAVYYVYMQDQE